MSVTISTLEKTVLRECIANTTFFDHVALYVPAEYFENDPARVIFRELLDLHRKGHTLPADSVLGTAIEAVKDGPEGHPLSEGQHAELVETFKDVTSLQPLHDAEQYALLYPRVESHFKTRARLHHVREIIPGLIDGSTSDTEIRDAIDKGLSFSLTPATIGHRLFSDIDAWYDEMTTANKGKIPFDLTLFNEWTNGGVPPQSLNVVQAGTGVGKSLTLCHMSAAALREGRNVLYVTMEVGHVDIRKRIIANLTDTNINDIESMAKLDVLRRMKHVYQTLPNRADLIVVELPAHDAHVGNIRALLTDLKIRKNWTPSLIAVDYQTLMAPEHKMDRQAQRDMIYRMVATELFNLSREQSVQVWTAVQPNREGYKQPSVTTTGQSMGIPEAATFYVALQREDGQDHTIKVSLLKNRNNRLFDDSYIGIDAAKMKLRDLTPAEKQDRQRTEDERLDAAAKASKPDFRTRRPSPLAGLAPKPAQLPMDSVDSAFAGLADRDDDVEGRVL